MKLKRRSKKNAFSLCEVVIAMGIVTFALVAILGLMPVGLATLRTAMDKNAECQILGQISGELMSTPFDHLGAYASNSPYYFDDDGQRLTSATNSIYSVLVGAPQSPSFPGAPSDMQTSLAGMRIQIMNPRSQGTNFARIQTIYIAKSELEN